MKMFYNAAPVSGFWKQYHIRANALSADANGWRWKRCHFDARAIDIPMTLSNSQTSEENGMPLFKCIASSVMCKCELQILPCPSSTQQLICIVRKHVSYTYTCKVLYCPCAHSPTLPIRSVLLKVKEIDPVIIPPWMSSQVLYDSAVVKICLYKADVRSTCMYILFQPMLKQALGEWSSRSPRMAPCCHRHLQRACKPRSVAAPKWDCLGQILSETSPDHSGFWGSSL